MKIAQALTMTRSMQDEILANKKVMADYDAVRMRLRRLEAKDSATAAAAAGSSHGRHTRDMAQQQANERKSVCIPPVIQK